jgi:putative oxidoreductase
MKTSRVISIFLARLFISLVFLVAGFDKLLSWHETENGLMDSLAEWQNYATFSETIQSMLTFLVPWSSVLLLIGVLFELIGAIMLLIGFRERFGAVLLILFIIPATLLYHSFWFFEGPARELQMTMFLKNLAILGGLIIVSIHGARASQDGSSMSQSSFS